MNITKIVLIPKVPALTNMTNFLPISLCNVLYKLVVKVIANQLRKILNACIDHARSAFFPRRLITDNIVLAYEMLHTFGKKRGWSSFMNLKLDRSKAFDRVEWHFLQVMGKMWFAQASIDLIMKCISTVSYSVCIDGFQSSPFRLSRGLQEGDPSSPFLFLICNEGLSALKRLGQNKGLFKGVRGIGKGFGFHTSCLPMTISFLERFRLEEAFVKKYT